MKNWTIKTVELLNWTIIIFICICIIIIKMDFCQQWHSISVSLYYYSVAITYIYTQSLGPMAEGDRHTMSGHITTLP